MTPNDMELVRAYARHHSEEAFAALVSRHVNLVYSVALHQLRDNSLAEDVTQAVFIILARKAGSLGPKTILSAWLCRTAQYAAANALRTECRRQAREQELAMEPYQPESETSPWPDIAPLLNVAMAELGEKYHNAIVLRFFESKDLKQVGAELGVDERTAQTRVRRAIEKLRKFFIKRGITLSAAVIAGAISANSVQAAPAAFAKSVTAVAITKGTAVSASTLILIKGVLKLMAWAKLKTALVAGTVLLLTAGTVTTAIVKVISHYREKAREDAVWSSITAIDLQNLLGAPPAVSIRPAKPGSGLGNAWVGDSDKQLASGKTIQMLLADAYHFRVGHIVAEVPLPAGEYDFIVSLPDHQSEALQAALKEKFGLVGQRELISTNVLLLKVAKPRARGLKPTSGSADMNRLGVGRLEIVNGPVSSLLISLENYFKIPVINQTHLAGRYDLDLKWNEDRLNPNPEALKQALLNKLGLELVPDTQTIEMLVVKKVK
jgi:uncharacterized protein (TIGR03435 family)